METTGAGVEIELTTGGGGATGSVGEETGAAVVRSCGAAGITPRGCSLLTGSGWTGFGAAGATIFAGVGGQIQLTNTLRLSDGGGMIL